MPDVQRSRNGVPRDATEARILETAGHVFAETGFQAAKVRDICARAGVNLAAVNYHFGDKLGLYKEVLNYAACAAGNAADFDPVLPGNTPEAKLRAFTLRLLQQIYGEDRPAWPVRLMTHELAQPTPAFDGAVIEQNRTAAAGKIRDLNALLRKGDTWSVEDDAAQPSTGLNPLQ